MIVYIPESKSGGGNNEIASSKTNFFFVPNNKQPSPTCRTKPHKKKRPNTRRE